MYGPSVVCWGPHFSEHFCGPLIIVWLLFQLIRHRYIGEWWIMARILVNNGHPIKWKNKHVLR